MSDPNCPHTQCIQRFVVKGKSLRQLFKGKDKDLPENREKVVVLGTGWASRFFVKQIDPTRFDVTVISPRPHFVLTPLLPTTLSGSLSFRSVLTPFRSLLHFGGKQQMAFLKAKAIALDTEAKKVTAEAGKDTFDVPYDRLVMATGSVTNTFGIPGVAENSFYLKEVADARRLKSKFLENFEKACLPGTSEEEARRLLNIAVIGGGPAGVEASAEFQDLISGELMTKNAEIAKLAKVSIVEMMPGLLGVFGKHISDYTGQQFDKQGINKYMKHRVVKIDAEGDIKKVHMKSPEGSDVVIDAGQVLWASGVGPNPFIRALMQKLQPGNRFLTVDTNLKVKGASDVYAMGDCCYVEHPKLTDKADQLYETACSSPYGPSKAFFLKNKSNLLRDGYSQVHGNNADLSADLAQMGKEAFSAYLKELDGKFRAPPPTAQMARQAGAYLGSAFNREGSIFARFNEPRPYAPREYGVMSYVGQNNAVLKMNGGYILNRINKIVKGEDKFQYTKLGGPLSSDIWHSYYMMNQPKMYNKVMSVVDRLRARIEVDSSCDE